MGHKKYVVELSAGERKQLGEVISKGKSPAKAILQARIVLKADQGADGEGWTDERICEALETNITMVARTRAKLVNEGLDAVLARKQRARPPIEPIFDGEAQAQLMALSEHPSPPHSTQSRPIISISCRSCRVALLLRGSLTPSKIAENCSIITLLLAVVRERHESVWLKRKDDISKAIPLGSWSQGINPSNDGSGSS